MEGLVLKLRVTRVGPKRDCHAADRVLSRFGSLRNARLCVRMIMFHVLPTFF